MQTYEFAAQPGLTTDEAMRYMRLAPENTLGRRVVDEYDRLESEYQSRCEQLLALREAAQRGATAETLLNLMESFDD